MARRARRQANQLPTCYYEGYLEKRSFKEKTSRKMWTCLCGNTLFFFNEKRDPVYIEKLNLSGFVSISDDSSQDRNLDAARFILNIKNENIKLTATNAEARELWKGFIYCVAKLSVPTYLNLLPGQIHMLREAIESEKERLKNDKEASVTSSGPYISVKADMPDCYYSVSRVEAELMLEKESKRGNLLLRPGHSGNSFAVTTRQDHDGCTVFKHYRVTRRPDGTFNIDVEDPVPCATLHDVVSYLVENTDGVLVPLIIEEPYEKNISFIRPDKENGELSVQKAPLNVPPTLPPKPVALKLPTADPVLDEKNLYEIAEDTEDHTDFSPVLPSRVQKKPTKMAIMPPTFVHGKLVPATQPPSTNSSINKEPRFKTTPHSLGQIPLAAMNELKEKLEKKANNY